MILTWNDSNISLRFLEDFFLPFFVIKGKNCAELNGVVIPQAEESMLLFRLESDKDFAISYKKLEFEKRDNRRSMLTQIRK